MSSGVDEEVVSTTCSVCEAPTNIRCSDCMIDLGKSAYVCRDRRCGDIHELVCPGMHLNNPQLVVEGEQ